MLIMYQNIRPSKHIFQNEFEKFINVIKQNGLVLDCASADFKNSFLFKNHNYVGCDLNLQRLKLGKLNYQKVWGINGNVTALPFKNQSFDAIISTHTLYHLGDSQLILNGIIQLIQKMKKRGSLFFTLPLDFVGNSFINKVDEYLDEINMHYKKILYRGTISKAFENLFVDDWNKLKKRVITKKILLSISYFLSWVDFLGTKNQVIYTCRF